MLHEPPARVLELATAIETGRLKLGAGPTALARAISGGPHTLQRVTNALETWAEGGGDRSLLARSLRGLVAVRQATEARGPSCELVWTGQDAGGPPVRSTAQAVDEMLRNARRSALVVSYSVVLGGLAGEAIVERLVQLAREGGACTVIVDARWNDGLSVRQVQQHWPTDAPRPDLWSFTNPDDAIAKLHAKVLLVDRRDLLVTSANLTGYGMQQNLEFGLRVSGQPAVDAADHFEALLRSGALDRVTWA